MISRQTTCSDSKPAAMHGIKNSAMRDLARILTGKQMVSKNLRSPPVRNFWSFIAHSVVKSSKRDEFTRDVADDQGSSTAYETAQKSKLNCNEVPKYHRASPAIITELKKSSRIFNEFDFRGKNYARRSSLADSDTVSGEKMTLFHPSTAPRRLSLSSETQTTFPVPQKRLSLNLPGKLKESASLLAASSKKPKCPGPKSKNPPSCPPPPRCPPPPCPPPKPKCPPPCPPPKPKCPPPCPPKPKCPPPCPPKSPADRSCQWVEDQRLKTVSASVSCGMTMNDWLLKLSESAPQFRMTKERKPGVIESMERESLTNCGSKSEYGIIERLSGFQEKEEEKWRVDGKPQWRQKIIKKDRGIPGSEKKTKKINNKGNTGKKNTKDCKTMKKKEIKKNGGCANRQKNNNSSCDGKKSVKYVAGFKKDSSNNKRDADFRSKKNSQVPWKNKPAKKSGGPVSTLRKNTLVLEWKASPIPSTSSQDTDHSTSAKFSTCNISAHSRSPSVSIEEMPLRG